MDSFLLCFIPLFVALDPVASVPIFLSLTNGFSKKEKKILALQAVVTALIIGIVFGMAGRYFFEFLGISSADFRIAGGLLLLIISVNEIVGSTLKVIQAPIRDREIGVVPLGIPLTAGPAMMTTVLILQDSHPYWTVMLALTANLVIMLIMFRNSESIERWVGQAASKALGKVIAIFLAAIGIMMIRKGLEFFLKT